MRITILVMLSTLASGNAMAAWKMLGTNDNGATSTYADPSTFDKREDKVKVWSMTDFKKAATLSDNKKFLSWETQYEFDCKTGQSRMLAASMHSKNMGKGEITHSLNFESPEWEDVPPDSNGDTLLKYACATQYQSAQDAQKHCPDDTVVWLNLASGIFHYKGQHWYGRTKTGAYVCKNEAITEGHHASASK